MMPSILLPGHAVMIPLIPHQSTIIYLLFLMASSLSVAVLANEQQRMVQPNQRQVARYSIVHPAPEKGQLDLLAVTAPVDMPQDITTLGGALTWLLADSGYQLAAPDLLSGETKAMLQLPLPNVHRRFEPLPLKQVIEILIGPAFRVVQDPVHRLIAFDRCRQDRSPHFATVNAGQ